MPVQTVSKSKEEEEKDRIEATTAAAMKYAQDLARNQIYYLQINSSGILDFFLALSFL